MARKNASDAAHADVASLLLRLSIGPMLVAHGTNKLAGAGGLAGTTRWFDALGFKPAWLHARLAAGTEIGSGALLTLGALTPLPSAAAIGLMTSAAATDHKGKGFFVFKGGWEYTAVIASVAAAIATLGPGRFSVDRLLGQQRRGARWGVAAAVFGVANAAALLKASYHPAPAVSTEETTEGPGSAEPATVTADDGESDGAVADRQAAPAES